MKALNLFGCMLGLFVVTPIWYFLLYKVLQFVGATDVMWLAFWIYVPFGLAVSAMMKIAGSAEKK
jgi:hypothetical protein